MTCHLLERYAALGIRLSADGDRLAIDAPAGTLTPGLVDDLRRNKPALLAALAIPELAPGPPMDSAPIGPGRPVVSIIDPDNANNLGDQASGPTSIPGRTSATIPAAIDATAGQVDDLGDRLPADGEWDSLPEPGPCPTCGGIDCWWGLWGERHCSVCEPSGQRSLLLADRAARLRERTCQKSARSIR